MKTYNKSTIYKRLLALLADTVILAAILALIYTAVLLTNGNMLIFFISIPVVALVYPNAFQFSSLAATPGMIMFGLYISFDHSKIHISHFKRMMWCIISCLPLGFGFWYAFFNRKGRTIYDIMSESDVVSLHKHGTHDEKTPFITIKHKNGKDKIYNFAYEQVTLGRNPDICDVLLSAEEISRVHCSITYNEPTNMFLLEDLGSSSGTYLENGMRLEPGKSYIMSPGDSFFLANTENIIITGISEN